MEVGCEEEDEDDEDDEAMCRRSTRGRQGRCASGRMKRSACSTTGSTPVVSVAM